MAIYFFNLPIMKRKFNLFTVFSLPFFFFSPYHQSRSPPYRLWSPFLNQAKLVKISSSWRNLWQNWGIKLRPHSSEKSLVPNYLLLCWLNSQNDNLRYCTWLIPLKIHALSLINHDKDTENSVIGKRILKLVGWWSNVPRRWGLWHTRHLLLLCESQCERSAFHVVWAASR